MKTQDPKSEFASTPAQQLIDEISKKLGLYSMSVSEVLHKPIDYFINQLVVELELTQQGDLSN